MGTPDTLPADPTGTGALEYGAPTLTVQLKMLDDGLEPPSYAHPGDAGADLRA
ncbi:MAG TPA: dUTP diphosphatase, partial [Arthrobacter sp.]|nr:dUTP diphosphatase [Arthrobacter sp.]